MTDRMTQRSAADVLLRAPQGGGMHSAHRQIVTQELSGSRRKAVPYSARPRPELGGWGLALSNHSSGGGRADKIFSNHSLKQD